MIDRAPGFFLLCKDKAFSRNRDRVPPPTRDEASPRFGRSTSTSIRVGGRVGWVKAAVFGQIALRLSGGWHRRAPVSSRAVSSKRVRAFRDVFEVRGCLGSKCNPFMVYSNPVAARPPGRETATGTQCVLRRDTHRQITALRHGQATVKLWPALPQPQLYHPARGSPDAWAYSPTKLAKCAVPWVW